jgi:hypothetical protein
MTNEELINVIDNLPKELFVPERFSGISFCNEYFNPALNCYIFIYWDNRDIKYEVKVYAISGKFVIALTKKESYTHETKSVAFKRAHKFIQKVAESFKAYLEILGYQGYIRLYDYE